VAAGIVVNELVTNACKHAFPEGTGTVRVALRREARAAVIEVADDGRGFTPEGTRKGLGTRLVRAFCDRMRAETEIRSGEDGTSHLIRVPLKA
jgi:two-component sensor histidine kinase